MTLTAGVCHCSSPVMTNSLMYDDSTRIHRPLMRLAFILSSLRVCRLGSPLKCSRPSDVNFEQSENRNTHIDRCSYYSRLQA